MAAVRHLKFVKTEILLFVRHSLLLQFGTQFEAYQTICCRHI